MSKIKVPIRGMHCASCEILIGEQLKNIPGVTLVHVDQKKALAELSYSGMPPTEEKIKRAVQEAGYDIGQKEKLPWLSSNIADYKDLAQAAIILVVVYLIAQRLNLFNFNVNNGREGVFVALLVGLVAGLSTCMALVGGLVLGLSARHAELHPEATTAQKFRPHLYFNLGRILGYAVLGGLVGLIGQAFKPSANVLGLLTIVIGGVMVFFGLKLIEIFPVLKDKSITLPSSIAKLFGLHREVKEYSHKGAMVMGALTFFLPCGFTQAMQLYAVSTGSFWQGLAIMGLFAIGTAPGLLGVGGLTSVFKGRRARIFFMTAGLAVIILGWINITNGSRLFGGGAISATAGVTNGQVQEVRMTQSAGGYSPNTFTVQKGRPVKWIINSTSAYSCAASIVMPKYGISQSLQAGENVITFTPTATGEIPFSCSMGMYRGKFIVIEDGQLGSASSNTGTVAVTGASCGGAGGGGCGGCGSGGQPRPAQEGTVESVTAADVTATEQVIKTVYTYNNDIVPNTFTVKRGQPVQMIVDVKEDSYGCMSTIMIPELYNTPERLTAGKTIIMTFTPFQTGEYQITCAMGVPRGTIKVVS